MQDLLDIIDDITINPMVTSVRRSSGFHPSAASVQFQLANGQTKTVGSCLRREWYSFSHFVGIEVTNAEAEDKKAVGDYISQRFVDKFKRAGLYVADEVPFYHEGMKVSGRIDIIIKDPFKAPKPPQRPNIQDLIGLEIKSTGGYYNIKGPIKSTKDTPLAPKGEHVLQCMVYLDYYSQFGIDRWFLIYQDRESMAKQWHKICIDENGAAVITNVENTSVWSNFTIQNIRARFKRLEEHLTKNELPPRDYARQYDNHTIYAKYKAGELNATDTKKIESILKKLGTKPLDLDKSAPLLEMGDWQCNYCPFKEKCWSNNPLDRSVKVHEVAEVSSEPDFAEDFS